MKGLNRYGAVFSVHLDRKLGAMCGRAAFSKGMESQGWKWKKKSRVKLKQRRVKCAIFLFWFWGLQQLTRQGEIKKLYGFMFPWR